MAGLYTALPSTPQLRLASARNRKLQAMIVFSSALRMSKWEGMQPCIAAWHVVRKPGAGVLSRIAAVFVGTA
jgi:hypothetical protein